MKNIIVIAVILVILGLAIGYIIKQKKSGTRCIGCPSGGKCSCGCSDCEKNKSGRHTKYASFVIII